ncbi:MAG: hypothetical protein D6785_08085, partial [Planctomycetota bacterium]
MAYLYQLFLLYLYKIKKIFPSKEKQHFLFFFLFLFLLYIPLWQNDFVNWDDNWLFSENPKYLHFQWKTLLEIWNPLIDRIPFGKEYLPIRDMSYFLEAAIFGVHPQVSHGIQLVLYYLQILLLYKILKIIFKKEKPAFWGAFLYMVHPFHVEPVVWTSSRKDMLMALFGFLSIYFFLKFLKNKKTKRLYLYSLLAFLLAFWSKYTIITLPLFLFCLYFWYHPASFKQGFRKAFLLVLPFFGVLFLFFPIALYVGKTYNIMPDFDAPLPLRLGTISHVLVNTFQKMIFPQPLLPLYIPPVYPLQGYTLALFLFWIGFVATITWYFFLKRDLFSLGVLTFFIFYLPHANILPSPAFIADRYLLLPSVSIAILVALWTKYSQPKRFYSLVHTLLCSALVVFFSFITFHQIQIWKNPETLWKEVLKYYPNSHNALINISAYYGDKGQWEKGEYYFQKAAKLVSSNKIMQPILY